MKKIMTVILVGLFIVMSVVQAFAATPDIVLDREGNLLGISHVTYKVDGTQIYKLTGEEAGKTVEVYADIANLYTLKYTYQNQLARGTLQTAGLFDAQYYVFTAIYEENKLESCDLKVLDLQLYPDGKNGSANYEMQDVCLSSVIIPENISNGATIQTFFWTKQFNNTYLVTDSEDPRYVPYKETNTYEPEFKPLILTGLSYDDEIKAITLNGKYGYINNDRNTITFITDAGYDISTSDEPVVVSLASGASVSTSGSIKSDSLEYIVTAENGDTRTYSTIVRPMSEQLNYTFDGEIGKTATSSNTANAASYLATPQNSNSYEIKAKTVGGTDGALYGSKKSGSSGTTVTFSQPAAITSPTAAFLQYDFNYSSLSAGDNYANVTLFGGRKVLQSNNRVATGYSLGVRNSGTGVTTGGYGNVLIPSTLSFGEWYTIAMIASLRSETIGNKRIDYDSLNLGGQTDVGTYNKPYFEFYLVDSNGVPSYLDESLIWDSFSFPKTWVADGSARYDRNSNLSLAANAFQFTGISATAAEFAIDNFKVYAAQ